MSKDELLDLVDENDEVIGSVWKSEAHGDPSKIHREADITLFTKDGEVLLQQRAMTKSSPGEWKNTATGHVLAEEDPKEAAIRELYEELGLNADPIFINKLFEEKDNESKFYWVYYSILEKTENFDLDPKEVMAARWVKVDKLDSFSKSNKINSRVIDHIKQIWVNINSKSPDIDC